MSTPISWHPFTGEQPMRRCVDPNAREGYKPVSLAWLKKHSPGRIYVVRWWEGPSGTEGEWKSKEFREDETTLRDVKTYAFMIAGSVTEWEVEITLRGRTHGNLGWDHGHVWEFGHYQRETEAAKATRGEA